MKLRLEIYKPKFSLTPWHCRQYWFCRRCRWDTTVSDTHNYCCRVYTPSESLQLWTGTLSMQWVVAEGKNVSVLQNENVESHSCRRHFSWLDNLSPGKLFLSLGVLGSVKNSTFSLIEIHLIKREWVRVFVVDKSAVFAVSHQIADAYDQAHGWVILN